MIFDEQTLVLSLIIGFLCIICLLFVIYEEQMFSLSLIIGFIWFICLLFGGPSFFLLIGFPFAIFTSIAMFVLFINEGIPFVLEHRVFFFYIVIILMILLL